ncbi:hypothetical protein Moror_15010 [Moniliophthora roreri MCA 2997]|uniref:F-box domain-containing protein n=2 Tax=Moniliophthora roreri TaxID=221103 RepID=V2XUT7_MONRO|nr:hypothetical protein Moror_15010 [Moniliophthora roreri MCA 2997]
MKRAEVPQELIDLCIDELKNDKHGLAACSLVARDWLPRARCHLFRRLCFQPTHTGNLEISWEPIESGIVAFIDLFTSPLCTIPQAGPRSFRLGGSISPTGFEEEHEPKALLKLLEWLSDPAPFHGAMCRNADVLFWNLHELVLASFANSPRGWEQVRLANLGAFASVRQLSLYRTPIDTSSGEFIHGFPSLNSITLSDVWFPGEDYNGPHFERHVPCLEKVIIERRHSFRDRGIELFSRYGTITELRLPVDPFLESESSMINQLLAYNPAVKAGTLNHLHLQTIDFKSGPRGDILQFLGKVKLRQITNWTINILLEDIDTSLTRDLSEVIFPNVRRIIFRFAWGWNMGDMDRRVRRLDNLLADGRLFPSLLEIWLGVTFVSTEDMTVDDRLRENVERVKGTMQSCDERKLLRLVKVYRSVHGHREWGFLV